MNDGGPQTASSYPAHSNSYQPNSHQPKVQDVSQLQRQRTDLDHHLWLLATLLALAGIVVACVQYRSYIRASDTTISPSSLETGLPLSPIITDDQSQERGEPDSTSKADESQLSSTCGDAGATQAQGGRRYVEIAGGSLQSVASA
jgi:hypothetical protein